MTSFVNATGIEAVVWVVTLRKTTIDTVAPDGKISVNLVVY